MRECSGSALARGVSHRLVNHGQYRRRDLQPLAGKGSAASVPPGAVVVLDNATFHKRQDTRAMMEEAGGRREYLPPYSPDLNPIEQKWAQAKDVKRRTGKTTDEIFSQTF